MKLVLFRHGPAGHAEKYLESHSDDSERPLTAKGREVTKSMAHYLKRWEPDFDMIVTSPFARAAETAEIVADVLAISNVFSCADLTPESQILSTVQWLETHADDAQSVLLVGHEPHLGILASWCLSGVSSSFFELKKSGMIALEVKSFSSMKAASAKLLWQISPQLLRSMS
jgi:phosphohistidine phosphatase